MKKISPKRLDFNGAKIRLVKPANSFFKVLVPVFQNEFNFSAEEAPHEDYFKMEIGKEL